MANPGPKHKRILKFQKPNSASLLDFMRLSDNGLSSSSHEPLNPVEYC